jgi:hypothetical protein
MMRAFLFAKATAAMFLFRLLHNFCSQQFRESFFVSETTDITYVYMQVVKRRKNKKLVTVKKCFVKGSAKENGFIEHLE